MKKIIAFLMCVICLLTPFSINTYAIETDSSITPEINISSVSFVKPNEIFQIKISLYDFDKIALSGGMYNIRIALPEALTIENLYKDTDIATDYSINTSNILVFSGDFHYDGNEEFAALTEYTLLCKISDGATAGKYDIKVENNSNIFDDSGNKIPYNTESGYIRIAGRDDSISGDVDKNVSVDATDMLYLKKSLLNIDADEELLTDTNADGITDVRDMIFLKKYFVSTYPIVYLSSTGDDRNGGTQTAPVRSLNKALELVSHGGTVNILEKYSLDSKFKWNHHSKTVNIQNGELDISALPTLLMGDNALFKNISITTANNNVFCTGGYIFALGSNASLSDSVIFSTAQTPPDNNTGSDSDTNLIGNTYKTGFPIVNEKETLSIMCVTRADLGDIANSEFTKDYEELTNIEIEWQLATTTEISNKKILALQSGNMPDIFATAMTDSEMLQYSNEGAFVEVTKDLLKEWAPNIYNTYEKYPEAWDNMFTSNGKMFSLAGLTNDINYAQHYWFVRTDWLKKLGLSKPKTMDQFYEMLNAFKYGDPNGNGQADEVPLATWSSDGFIFNPWGFTNTIDVDTNGKVYNMYTTSNMKNAVTYWAKVYKEGLVDKNTINNWAGNNAAFMTLINSGKVGCFWYGWPNLDAALMKEYETLEYPTAGNNGTFPTQAINVTSMVSRGSLTITSKCENVPAALRWIDYLFTNDGYMLKQYGSIGNYYTKTSDTTYKLTGTPISVNAGPKWSIRCRDFLDGATITNQVVSPMYVRRYAIDDWCEATLKTNSQKFLPTTWKSEEEINAENTYTTYWNEVSGSWWDFIQGKKNMGTDWTSLVNEMKANGIDNYITELQEYYNRCNS